MLHDLWPHPASVRRQRERCAEPSRPPPRKRRSRLLQNYGARDRQVAGRVRNDSRSTADHLPSFQPRGGLACSPPAGARPGRERGTRPDWAPGPQLARAGGAGPPAHGAGRQRGFPRWRREPPPTALAHVPSGFGTIEKYVQPITLGCNGVRKFDLRGTAHQQRSAGVKSTIVSVTGFCCTGLQTHTPRLPAAMASLKICG